MFCQTTIVTRFAKTCHFGKIKVFGNLLSVYGLAKYCQYIGKLLMILGTFSLL